MYFFGFQNIKVPFGIGHPRTYTSNLVYMCAEGSRVPNLQTELNYLHSFKSYCNSSDLGFLSSGGWGRWVGVSGVISYSLYEFRNVQRYRIFKQNRIISISSGLFEFCCFGLPAALGRGQVVGGCQGHLGAWGCLPIHAHTCTCMHTHIRTCIHV